MASTYAWVIKYDHLDHKKVDVRGPREAAETGRQFRIYDDDGELNYSGRFAGDSDSEDGFGPLDDYGAPNAGATEIRYLDDAGEWVGL